MKTKLLLVLVLALAGVRAPAAGTKPLWDWFMQSSGDVRGFGLSNVNYLTFTNASGSQFTLSNASTGLELWCGDILMERLNTNGTRTGFVPATHSSLVVTGALSAAVLVVNGQTVSNLPPGTATILTNNGSGYSITGAFTGSLAGPAATATSAGNAQTAAVATNLAEAAGISSATVTGTVNFATFARLLLSKKSVGSVANGNNVVNLGTNIVTEISGPTAAFTNNAFTTEDNTEGDLRILLYQGAQAWVIANESGYDGTAANRILTLTGADVSGSGPFAAWFRYTASRWRLFALYPTPPGAYIGGTGGTGTSNVFHHPTLTNVAALVFRTNTPDGILMHSPSRSGTATNDGFFWSHTATPFDSGAPPDEVSMWGHNLGGGGQRMNSGPGATAFGFALEGSYNSGGKRYAEAHLHLVDTNAIQHRVMSSQFNKDHLQESRWDFSAEQMTWFSYTGSVWTNFAHFSPGTYKWWNSGRTRYAQLSFSGTDAVWSLQGGSGNLDLNSFSTVVAPGASLNAGTVSFTSFLNTYNNKALSFYTGNGSGLWGDLRNATGLRFDPGNFIGFSTNAGSGAKQVGDTGLRRHAEGWLAVTNDSRGYGGFRAATNLADVFQGGALVTTNTGHTHGSFRAPRRIALVNNTATELVRFTLPTNSMISLEVFCSARAATGPTNFTCFRKEFLLLAHASDGVVGSQVESAHAASKVIPDGVGDVYSNPLAVEHLGGGVVRLQATLANTAALTWEAWVTAEIQCSTNISLTWP